LPEVRSWPRAFPETIGDRGSKLATIRFTLPPDISAEELPPALHVRSVNGKLETQADRPLAVVGALAHWAEQRGVDIPDLEVFRPTLEDIYLELTEEPG